MFELFKTLLGSGAKPQSLLTQARNQFLEMCDLASELLAEILPHLLDQPIPDELIEHARSADKTSNGLERTIRKLLIEHLAFDTTDAPACLVLMSVAKDGERLLDECRNLIDQSTLITDPVPADYRATLCAFGEEVLAALSTTRTTFSDNDERKALDLVEGEKPFIARLHERSDLVLDDEQLTARQAVVISNAYRSIQRIRAHLGNIASTVVFPVHRIDFVKSQFIKQARQRLDEQQG